MCAAEGKLQACIKIQSKSITITQKNLSPIYQADVDYISSAHFSPGCNLCENKTIKKKKRKEKRGKVKVTPVSQGLTFCSGLESE